MRELEELKKIAKPDEIFYVADSMTGVDAIRTASTFNDKIGTTGVVLSKYDGDSKGGVALGIAKLVGVPLRFIGLGEKMPDLEQFIPDRVVSRLMGAGDLESLAGGRTGQYYRMRKKAKESHQGRFRRGKFNFNDFLRAD